LGTSPKLGFGAFLLGLGIGWLIFTRYEVSGNVFSWLLILAGAGVIVSALIQWIRPKHNLGGLVGGLMGGLILSLFITTGFSFITGVFEGETLGDYRAQDTRSFDGITTVDSIYLEVNIFNGPIRVSTWGKNEYSIDLIIKAKGITDAEAKKNLEDFKVTFDESVAQGQGRFILRHNVPSTQTSKYSVQVEVFLPAQADIDLDLVSSNGGIYLTDLEGDTLNLRTSNGEFVFDEVFAERIDGDTSNGRIRGTVESTDTSLTTSNGEIELTLQCKVTGKYVLSTSNGAIDLKVSSSSGVGYSLDLSTSNGSIEIDLPNLSYTTDQRTKKIAKTTDFDSKDVQITIRGSTSNSGIDVED